MAGCTCGCDGDPFVCIEADGSDRSTPPMSPVEKPTQADREAGDRWMHGQRLILDLGDQEALYDTLARHRLAAAQAARTTTTEEREGRFWIIVHEPGLVPDRKGPYPATSLAAIMREFIATYPVAYLHVLTVRADGVPDVQHGPEALQMRDGRSMSVGRKHNARTLAAHGSSNPYVDRWRKKGWLPPKSATHPATPAGGGEREAVARALADRWIARGDARVTGPAPYRSLDDMPRSYSDDFYADADAVLAALSPSPDAAPAALKSCTECYGEGWAWSDKHKREVPCAKCEARGHENLP